MQAGTHYSKAIELEPGLLVAYNNRAMARLKTEDWHGALEDCHHVLAIEPDNVKALLRQASAKCVPAFLYAQRLMQKHVNFLLLALTRA